MPELFPFATSDFVPEDEAKALITPFEPELTDVWRLALRDLKAMEPDHRARLAETANIPSILLFGFAQSYAREFFSGREYEGIETCEDLPGVFAFYISGKLLVRFNVLTRHHVVRDVRDKPFRRRYYSQEPIRGLNNAASRVTVGYTLDESHTELASIGVSMQFGNSLVFYFDIDDQGGGILSVPSPKDSQSPNQPNSHKRKNKPR